MTELVNQVEKSIQGHRLFRRKQAIIVAVSGGVDSMVLLKVLHELSGQYGWNLRIAHLNHRLRRNASYADERLVRRMAQHWNIPITVERVDVRSAARSAKISVEMAARNVRHNFLARVAREYRARSIALAHHADDQVELFFLRLLRGSGGEGLVGMSWQNASPADSRIVLARPLLELTKASLIEYARQHDVPFRTDASNNSLEFLRNRVRHELLPRLRRYQPAIHSIILRSMEIIGSETEFIMQAASEWLGNRARLVRAGHRNPGGMLTGQFGSLPKAVQRQVLKVQLTRLKIEPNYELIEWLRTHPERTVAVPGSSLERNSGKRRYLLRDKEGRLRQVQGSQGQFQTAVAAVQLGFEAGQVQFNGLTIQWDIRSAHGPKVPAKRRHRECFDAEKVGSRVLLRHWQPGDRFQPIGMSKSVKLQDFFTNEKIPRYKRHHLTLAEAENGEIFWVENLRISERFKLTKATRRRLNWAWNR